MPQLTAVSREGLQALVVVLGCIEPDVEQAELAPWLQALRLVTQECAVEGYLPAKR
jgi:hypothetical protein